MTQVLLLFLAYLKEKIKVFMHRKLAQPKIRQKLWVTLDQVLSTTQYFARKSGHSISDSYSIFSQNLKTILEQISIFIT